MINLNRITSAASSSSSAWLIALLSISLLNSTVQATSSSDLEPKTRIIDGLNGVVAAYGDFNSDKFTDLFLITENGMCFDISKQIPDQTESDDQVRSWCF